MPIRFLSTAKPYGDYPVAESQDIQHGDKRLNTVIGEIQTVNAGKADKTYVDTELAKKVDKVNGKGLSTNDYTTAEKTKLAGIAEGATKVTVDSALSTTSTNAVQNKAAATAINSKAEKSYVDTEIAKKVDKETGKGLSTNDYTTAEKTKLAGIATGATKVTVDDTLSATSSNPIANGPVTTALSGKVDKVTGKGLSTNDYTSAEKTKLSGIETGATKTIVDDTLTTSSTNPIQNKAVATALNAKAEKTYVDTELAKKANTSDVSSRLDTKADNTIVSALDDRVGTAETNIATQTARIDNIAVLPSGSTSGDAELMDIRVGADSVTYTSAGASVRAQITNVKSDLSQLNEDIANKLDKKEYFSYKNKSGKRIEINDSIIDNGLKILGYNKNYLHGYTVSGSPSTSSGLSIDVADGIYKFNGTSGNGGAYRVDTLFRQNHFVLNKGTYTISVDNTITQDLRLFINQYSNNADLFSIRLNEKNSLTFTISNDTEIFISFNSASQLSYDNLALRVMIAKSGNIESFIPPTDINIKVNSSNIFDASNFVQREGYSNLILAENGKTSDRIRITGYDSGGRFASFNIKTVIGEKYTFSYAPFAGSGIEAIYWKESDSLPTNWLGYGTKMIHKCGFTYIASKEYMQITFELNAGNAWLDYVKFESGTKKEYERCNSKIVTLPYQWDGFIEVINCGKILNIECDYNISIDYCYNSENEIKASNKNWSDKVWCVVGDSLTDKMERCKTNYHDYIHEETGISVINFGVAGTGYIGGSDGFRFYQRMSELEIYATPDVITIFGSGNDASLVSNNTYRLGTASDSIEDGTYAGYVNECIDKIYQYAPNSRLGIISPTPWIGNMPDHITTMGQISDMLKQIADRRGIPFLDLYRTSGFRVNDSDFVEYYFKPDVNTSLSADGIHPNSKGQKWISSQIKSFISNMID